MRFVKTKLIYFFLVYQLAFVLWAWMSYVENGALPPPFFRDVNDTLVSNSKCNTLPGVECCDEDPNKTNSFEH